LEGRELYAGFPWRSPTEHEAICWEHRENQGVRVGDWKLVSVKNAQAGWELYNYSGHSYKLEAIIR
jgi:hypothetical protein